MPTDIISVLVADDLPSNRFLLRRILEQRGYHVVEADGGQSALQALIDHPCDIALLDVMMPDLDGFSVCRAIRKTKTSSELPVLFITAKIQDSDLAEGFSAGGNDYIAKPISTTVLIARLESQVQLLQTNRALKASYLKLSEQKRMETVGLFASGMAHNFNNLLGTILGTAELIEIYGKGDQRIEKAAQLAATAAKKGAELTESLLTFSRKSNTPARAKPVELLKAALTVLPLLREPNITIESCIPGNLPEVAMSGLDLSQVLVELLRNALESIEEKGKISATAFEEQRNNESRVVFRIADTGRGMSPELVDRIFEPFQSTKNLDPMMGLSLDGSGLGLSVAYNLLKRAGGDIHVLETGPKGTTFEFSVPTASAEQS